MAEENSWRTGAFRQSVIAKIDEAIQRSGMPTAKNSVEMENHVFQKATTREEYLGFVARLILHIREMNSKKAAGISGPGSGNPAMPDPINALQTLARQGTGNSQMMGMGGPQNSGMAQQPQSQVAAATLLQSLNPRPGMQGSQGLSGLQSLQSKMPEITMGPVSQVSSLGQMQNQMRVPMGGQMPGQMQPQMTGQIQTQMQPQMPGQMPAQLSGAITGQLPSQMPGQMAGQLTGQLPGQMQHNMAQIQNQRKPGAEVLMMPGQNPTFGGPRNVTPAQFLRQSPSPSAQSPAGQTHGNQMAASPAMVPSPSSQHTPMSGLQRSVGMAASPSSSLNTPGQAVPTPSPCSLQEDQAYREKVRQLSKYIEPLRRMIAKMGNDDVEKLSKMKKLLEILSNPSKRMPLETLLKCEVVLEKLDLKRNEGSVGPPLPPLSSLKEHHIFNSLLEAVSQHMYSPVINHTLQRTFRPSLEALFGPEIKMMPTPLKKKKVEETPNDIPEVLQGEIARFDQRFKVSLDPMQQVGSKTVQLVCWLDDRHLPCVPPISLYVPDDYPQSPPRCHLAPHEYSATQFLSAVQRALEARIAKLPGRYSVSQLLDTWEMSVRQASAPALTPVSAATVLMGL